MKRPSTYPREERWFTCRCGAFVLRFLTRPEIDRLDDSICLNCWYGGVRGLDNSELVDGAHS